MLVDLLVDTSEWTQAVWLVGWMVAWWVGSLVDSLDWLDSLSDVRWADSRVDLWGDL